MRDPIVHISYEYCAQCCKLIDIQSDKVCASFTRHADISQHGLLAVFDAADLREVHIQSQEGHAAEEGHGAHEDAIVAGVLVAVEDAVLLHFVGAVDVALVGDAAKDHYGEDLQRGKKRKEVTVRKQIRHCFEARGVEM